jgi:hypothetical protein
MLSLHASDRPQPWARSLQRQLGKRLPAHPPSPRPQPLPPPLQSYWATSDERKGYSGVTTWCASPAWGPVDAEADGLGCREGRIIVTDHGPFAVVNV